MVLDLSKMTNYELERHHQQLENLILSSYNSNHVQTKINKALDECRLEISKRIQHTGGDYWAELQEYMFYEAESAGVRDSQAEHEDALLSPQPNLKSRSQSSDK
jgi:hypothetical protein